MLHIVVPMAGAGSRFKAAGYELPKPLIPIHGVPMIRLVINNLTLRVLHRFTFICQDSHLHEYGLVEKLESWAPGCNVVAVRGLTEGAACTVLAARDSIDADEPLMIANSDQYIDTDLEAYLEEMDRNALDGLIMTMTARDPKWSFVGLGSDRSVERVVEKEVISDEATVGIYNFRRGSDFVRAAESMIAKNLRVNGEFYVAPTYNELIGGGARVGIFNIGTEDSGMHGLGTPADLEAFLSRPLASRIASSIV